MVVGARQSFQFLRQNTLFSKTIELCLNFYIEFCIYTFLVLPNYEKINL